MSRVRIWILTLSALILAGSLALVIRHRSVNHIDANTLKNQEALPLTDLTVHRDLAYESSGDRHKLDIYSRPDPSRSKPVIVFFYGGTWIEGSKAEYAWVGAALARQGYVVVVADYRVYPEGQWPGFIQDNASAVRWTHDNISKFGGDPRMLYIMGHSAGAVNAMSLAVDDRWLNQVGMDPLKDIKGVIALSGPFEFVPDTGPLRSMFGPKTQWADVLPNSHVNGRSPPALLLTGDQDEAASPLDSDHLAALIQSKGGSATLIHYPSLKHNGTVTALAPLPGETSTLLTDVNTFITKH
jgi:acetyl esterase/lipase